MVEEISMLPAHVHLHNFNSHTVSFEYSINYSEGSGMLPPGMYVCFLFC